MIHCRPSKKSQDAYEDLLPMFKSLRFNGSIILHFFVGDLETAKKFLKSGAYFTFGGVITFARDYDEVIKYIPVERIFCETDAPYVAPEPFRGQRNEPSFVIEVAKKLAEIKAIKLDTLLETQAASFFGCFKKYF